MELEKNSQNVKKQQIELKAKAGFGYFLKKFWHTIKRFWALFLAIIILGACIGLIISFVRKPNYTASEYVAYTATDTSIVDDEGKIKQSSTHLTVTRTYLQTVADEFTQPNAVNLADRYYTLLLELQKDNSWLTTQIYIDMLNGERFNFRKMLTNSMLNLNYDVIGLGEDEIKTVYSNVEFVGKENVDREVEKDNTITYSGTLIFKNGTNEFKLTSTEIEDNDYVFVYHDISKAVDFEQIKGKGNISRGSISVTSYTDDEDMRYCFLVNYKDSTYVLARDKAKILILAVDKFVKTLNPEKPAIGATTYYKYFETVQVNLVDMNTASYTVDMTKTKIVVISTLIGLATAILLAIVIIVLDRTIKSKEELESIVGSALLASISEREDK